MINAARQRRVMWQALDSWQTFGDGVVDIHDPLQDQGVSAVIFGVLRPLKWVLTKEHYLLQLGTR